MDSPNALSYLIVYCQCPASLKDCTHDSIVIDLHIIIHIYIYKMALFCCGVGGGGYGSHIGDWMYPSFCLFRIYKKSAELLNIKNIQYISPSRSILLHSPIFCLNHCHRHGCICLSLFNDKTVPLENARFWIPLLCQSRFHVGNPLLLSYRYW